MALPHVDNAVRLLGIEAERCALADFQRAQRRPPAAVGRGQMGVADLGGESLLRQRAPHSRDEIAAISLVIGMLELAAAAFREMAARRLLVMRPGRQRAIIEQRVAGYAERDVATARGHAIAA